MRKRTRSILQELSSINRTSNNDALIQSTGNNLIESSINLLNRITESYSPEVAQEMERRFINSIRSGDPRKFKRGIDKIIEDKDKFIFIKEVLNKAYHSHSIALYIVISSINLPNIDRRIQDQSLN